MTEPNESDRPEAVTVDLPGTRPPSRTVEYTPRPGGDATAETLPPTTAARPRPEIAGYDIAEEIGRGGMGVVYRATQVSLDRVVALKVILAGIHAGRDQRTRFRAEAHAVAKLQHPNVVQVFEVGEADDFPYLALEYVAGGSLERKIGRQPQPPHEVARLVEAVARAVAYAHAQGVTHRDLKPANVLLTPDGSPKIADFGLAKADDFGSHTTTGAVVGTPFYMAPEQARGGKDVGPAADLYSLGAVLYDLLTGRPPFHGGSTAEILEQVQAREPVPPTRLQPGIPRDLETICLKCLQKEPAKRYASGGELADDLARFLAGEPIRARPVGAVERAWRWCRRNPRVAVPSAAALALLLAAAIGSLVALVKIDAARRDAEVAKIAADKALAVAERERADAEAARRVADEKHRAALDQHAKAVDPLLALAARTHAAVEKLPDDKRRDPAVIALRNDVLNTVIDSVQRTSDIAEQTGVSPFGMIRAHLALAPILKQLWAADEAIREYTRAVALAEKAAAANPKSPKAAGNHGVMLEALGDAIADLTNDHAAARGHYQKSVAAWEECARRAPYIDASVNDPSRERMRDGRAKSLDKLGWACLSAGDPAAARDAFRAALAERDELYKADRDGVPMKLALAFFHTVDGEADFRQGDAKAAATAFADALTILDALAATPPLRADVARDLIRTCGLRGDLSLRTGDPAAAKPYYDRALELAHKLAAALGGEAKGILAGTLYRRGCALATLDPAAALADFRECLAIREESAKAAPDNRSRQALFVLTLARCGRHADAAEAVEKLRPRVKPTTGNQLHIAATYALCSAAPDADAATKERYAESALAALKPAVDPARKDLAHYATDPDLDPLRDRAEFKAAFSRGSPARRRGVSPTWFRSTSG
ncbi:MAG: serine/threonine-protein kinase [Gemmataceae bacterium]